MDSDPLAAWLRLRESKGRRATVIDLYRLVAEPRGLAPYELPREERLRLARLALPYVWPGFSVTTGSERRDPIVVVDYDPTWSSTYDAWRTNLRRELGDVALRIDHVGSTSVVGLAAKPIVDIQVSVAGLEDEDRYAPDLEQVGLQLRSRDELHRYFRPFPGEPRQVHVHVCGTGSAWEREHLLFRDYLRTHEEARRSYAETKRAAAMVWVDDGWGYTDAKSEIILDILESAEDWASAQGWRP